MASKLGNIVFECDNPTAMCEFWGAVFEYPPSEFPPGMRDALLASGMTEQDLLRRGVAQDPTGEGPRLFFRTAHSPKEGRNRMHIDIQSVPGQRPTPEQVDSEMRRISELGATVELKVDRNWGPYPEYYYVMRDPEQNQFCIQ